jgi:hypothetical protein
MVSGRRQDNDVAFLLFAAEPGAARKDCFVSGTADAAGALNYRSGTLTSASP